MLGSWLCLASLTLSVVSLVAQETVFLGLSVSLVWGLKRITNIYNLIPIILIYLFIIIKYLSTSIYLTFYSLM